MIQKYFFSLLLLFSIPTLVNAQVITEDQQKARLVSLQKDTSFIRFESQLNTILKTAEGRKTNFNAVKKMFAVNKGLLQQLKSKHSITAISPVNQNQYMGPNDKPGNLTLSIKEKPHVITPVKVVNYYPPYTEKEIHDYINPGIGGTAESGSNSNAGKIAITTSVAPGDTHWYDAYVFVFRQSVKVPDDPTIVKAQVRFYYTYFSTGWDTETGNLSTDLVINASANFVSPTYNQLDFRTTPPSMTDWKEIVSVAKEYFTGLRDYSLSKDSSYLITGNVTPGSTINFKFGMSFTPYSNRVGDFGAYHYREYVLTKIVVSYYKAN